MSDKTQIEWTEATWNVITGCDIESPGCIHCYAMGLAGTRLKHHHSRIGLTKQAANGQHVWTGEVRFNGEWLDQPLRWMKPRNIFVCAHGDLFHPSVPDAWIDKVFAVMARARDHTYQVLTKRAKRMHEYLTDPNRVGRILEAAYEIPLCAMEAIPWPLPNVQLGVSVEDQQRANERIPWLLASPASIRWVSAEPLLEEVDLRYLSYKTGDELPEAMRVNDDRCSLNALQGITTWPGSHYQSPTIKREMRIMDGQVFESSGESRRIDWCVVGGESGARARPMNPRWARLLRDTCVAAEVKFFFKQHGEWSPEVPSTATEFETFCFKDRQPVSVYKIGKKAAGRILDGRTWDEFPNNEAN